MNIDFIKEISETIRYYILRSTSLAGSGHLTSSLSAVELMTTLFHGNFFKYDIQKPNNKNNDILIFSKGHASPLLYSLWASVGGLEYKELDTLRIFGSRLEGHPTLQFPYTFAPTGSLGQGLSIGIGSALANNLNSIKAKTYVLLGDGELAEGSNWEAFAIASHYGLNNLCAMVDVNRLEQVGPTMLEWDTETYQKRISSFGWDTVVIDGHNIEEIAESYIKFSNSKKPFAIIAKTIKGKGIKEVENIFFHGKTLSIEEYENVAKKYFSKTNKQLIGNLSKPESTKDIKEPTNNQHNAVNKALENIKSPISTRKAYGIGLTELGKENTNIVTLDAGTNNSTFSEIFKESIPNRYLEMYVAEQNMVGTGVGLSRKGFVPFISTFSAFTTRAFDQLRMAQYSQVNLNICGSHAGASFGLDGASQFGLEDIAMMRSFRDSVVLYPSDGISTIKLLEKMYKHKGICYLRTTRMDTPIIYSINDDFNIGGSKTVHKSNQDKITIIGAGITLHESIKAYKLLKEQNINTRIIDLYSVKPLDKESLNKAIKETKAILVVEDHYPNGGIYSAICELFGNNTTTPIYQLSVYKEPKTGKPEDLLSYEAIDAKAIFQKTLEIISPHNI